MRLWSIHPKYLDRKGLIALWREALLAQAVLSGKTNGYTNHPQLLRFRNCDNPVTAISVYLNSIYQESIVRDYHFNSGKILSRDWNSKIYCTTGQVGYEFIHLKKKLLNRDLKQYQSIQYIETPDCNPFFTIIDGDVENWEVIKHIT